MKVEIDEEYRNKIIEKITKIRRRSGYHVTDLIFCLRKKYFEVKGVDAKRNHRIAIAGLLGTSLHMGIEYGELFTEVRAERNGIVGTVDMIDGEYVVDFKTTRGPPEPREHWIYQLMAYCYLFNKEKARLVIFQVIRPEVVVYKFEFENPEICKLWSTLVARKSYLDYCIKNNRVPDIDIALMFDWECKNCPYKEVCRNDLRKSSVSEN